MGYITTQRNRAFALPTVLIASVVLMIVLSVSVTATTSIRNALKSQYYAQLAQVAGEAGVAYAQACLAESNNVVTWSDAQPLTPATNCSGVNMGITCPSDARCWVAVDGNVRSGFSVPAPDLDSSGRPVLIEQAGYVELTRTSTGAVWRTYRQPSVQAAVVPQLCSGASKSELGWTNAAITTATGTTFPTDTTARPISISAAASIPGPVQYRKDFSISQAGTYSLAVKGDDRTTLYLDGKLIATTSNNNETALANIELTTGCHVIQGSVTGDGIVAGNNNLQFRLRKSGDSRETVVSDTSWRMSVGNSVHFSEPGYYTSPSWLDARVISAYNGAPYTAPTDWLTYSNSDTTAEWISSNANYVAGNYPFASYSYHRTKSAANWVMGAATEVRLSLACDDSCSLYIDGTEVLSSASPTQATTGVVTLSAGPHSVGVQLYNGGAVATTSGFLFSARRTSDDVVIDRSNAGWVGTDAWYSAVQTMRSYETTFKPSPEIFECNCSTQGTTNLLLNPSAETGLATFTGINATLAQSATTPQSGSYTVQSTVDTLGVWPRVVVRNTLPEPGRVYVLSGHIQSLAAARMGYQFIDAMGSPISVGGTSLWQTSAGSTGAGYARFNLATQPVPAGTVAIDIRYGVADNTTIGTVFRVDSMMMTAGPSTYNYGSGATPTWIWNGADHGSTSYGPLL